jgi:polyribonucleotide nucleotidyltransferase
MSGKNHLTLLVHFQGFNMETGVNCNLLSVDGLNDPEVLSINATSAAVALSDIPWGSPAVGAVRLGLLGGQVLVNPTRRQLSQR